MVSVVPVGIGRSLSVRASGTREDLAHTYGAVRERDRLGTGYAEAALTTTGPAHVWVAGAAFRYDGLRAPDVAGFDYAFTTPGVFAQDTYTPRWGRDSALALTASARIDSHSRYGTVASPRLALLLRPATTGVLAPYSLRLSGGSGFYPPTPFTEETAQIGLAPLRRFAGLVAERARSGAADLTARYGPVRIDGSVFAASIAHPVGLRERPDSMGRLALVNLGAPSRAAGAEIVARLRTDDVDLFGYYTYVRATELDPDTGRRRDTPLDPRHQAGVDLLFEPIEGSRVGVEAFYTGRQSLVDDPYRTVSRPYITFGLLAQVQLGPAQLFANAENLTDVRQTRYDPLVLPRRGPGGRWTTDAWAPLEGRVLNVGVRLTHRPNRCGARQCRRPRVPRAPSRLTGRAPAHDADATPDAKRVRRVVRVVALANLGYFGIEFAVALAIGSVALFADSVDFLEDAAVNLLIFVALGWTARRRAAVGMGLAGVLLVPGVATCGRSGTRSSTPAA